MANSWKFFLNFNKYSKSVEVSAIQDSVKESLFLLLSTTPGERILEPEYGCDLNKLAFCRIDLSLETSVRNDLFYAIAQFEPRITAENIDITQENELGKVYIMIYYKINDTNIEDHLSYKLEE